MVVSANEHQHREPAANDRVVAMKANDRGDVAVYANDDVDDNRANATDDDVAVSVSAIDADVICTVKASAVCDAVNLTASVDDTTSCETKICAHKRVCDKAT